jgi:hypothetical protein
LVFIASEIVIDTNSPRDLAKKDHQSSNGPPSPERLPYETGVTVFIIKIYQNAFDRQSTAYSELGLVFPLLRMKMKTSSNIVIGQCTQYYVAGAEDQT